MSWVEVTWIDLSLDDVKGTDVEPGCAQGASPAHDPPHPTLHHLLSSACFGTVWVIILEFV